MDNAPLKETLAKLQDELKSVGEVDESSREALKKLESDLHLFLQYEGDLPPAHHFSLKESLENSLEYFEATHPVITDLMTRLIKALSDMGI